MTEKRLPPVGDANPISIHTLINLIVMVLALAAAPAVFGQAGDTETDAADEEAAGAAAAASAAAFAASACLAFSSAAWAAFSSAFFLASSSPGFGTRSPRRRVPMRSMTQKKNATKLAGSGRES